MRGRPRPASRGARTSGHAAERALTLGHFGHLGHLGTVRGGCQVRPGQSTMTAPPWVNRSVAPVLVAAPPPQPATAITRRSTISLHIRRILPEAAMPYGPQGAA